MIEKTTIKENIFNPKQYTNTKKGLTILYTIFICYLQLTNHHQILVTILILTTIAGIIYFILKLNFYNTKKNTKDIIFLILFVFLLLCVIYV